MLLLCRQGGRRASARGGRIGRMGEALACADEEESAGDRLQFRLYGIPVGYPQNVR